MVLGRSEDGSEGIFLWADGFSQKQEKADVFAFRQQRSRETVSYTHLDVYKRQMQFRHF